MEGNKILSGAPKHQLKRRLKMHEPAGRLSSSLVSHRNPRKHDIGIALAKAKAMPTLSSTPFNLS
jgi:hypothetical protein